MERKSRDPIAVTSPSQHGARVKRGDNDAEEQYYCFSYHSTTRVSYKIAQLAHQQLRSMICPHVVVPRRREAHEALVVGAPRRVQPSPRMTSSETPAGGSSVNG